jgi:hypothetical protein
MVAVVAVVVYFVLSAGGGGGDELPSRTPSAAPDAPLSQQLDELERDVRSLK